MDLRQQRADACGSKARTQELNVRVTKEALLRIDHEAALLQDGEDHGQVLAMSCRVGAVDQDVIQV
jgi:hypothetical protein